MSIDQGDSIFTTNAPLTEFEVFASDQPLDASDSDGKFSTFDQPFNSPWSSVMQVTDNAVNASITTTDNEPWELEDVHEEKTGFDSDFASAFPQPKQSNDQSNENFFADAFNPTSIDEEQRPTKKFEMSETPNEIFVEESTLSNPADIQEIKETSAIVEHEHQIRKLTDSPSNGSDELEIHQITPTFTKPMEIEETNDPFVSTKIEHPIESLTLAATAPSMSIENENPPPEIAKAPTSSTSTGGKIDVFLEICLTLGSSVCVFFVSDLDLFESTKENIRLKSTLSTSDSESKEKNNLRADSELPSVRVDEQQTMRSSDSGKLIFTIVSHWICSSNVC